MLRLATLRDFTDGEHQDLASAISRVAKALHDFGSRATVRFVILDNRPPTFTLAILDDRCDVKVEPEGAFDLEITMRTENARALLDGSLSPLDAFLHGQLRVRGDIELGMRLLRHLAASQQAQFDICRTGGVRWQRRRARRPASKS